MTPPLPSPSRRWPWLRLAGLVLLALLVASVWRKTLQEQAIRDVRATGLVYIEDKQEVWALAREDWRNLFKRKTWLAERRVEERSWHPGIDYSLDSSTAAFRKLSVDAIHIHNGVYHVDAFHDLPSLKILDLSGCYRLQNVDGLHDLASLQGLYLYKCSDLQNVDGLRALAGLRELDLTACHALRNVDGVRGLTSLEKISLADCVELENVDALHGLTSLRMVIVNGCQGLSSESVNSLRAALPHAEIIDPDRHPSHGSIR